MDDVWLIPWAISSPADARISVSSDWLSELAWLWPLWWEVSECGECALCNDVGLAHLASLHAWIDSKENIFFWYLEFVSVFSPLASEVSDVRIFGVRGCEHASQVVRERGRESLSVCLFQDSQKIVSKSRETVKWRIVGEGKEINLNYRFQFAWKSFFLCVISFPWWYRYASVDSWIFMSCKQP